MPRDTNSPFTPGLPVLPEFFVGREAEIDRLKLKAASSTDGHLEVGFLTGERGIGKSSLASFVRILAEREHKALGIHTFLGGVTSLEEMVRRIFDRLLKEGIDAPWQQKLIKFFGKHIQEVGLFGVSLEFRAGQEDLRQMVQDFSPALRNLANQLNEEKRGIFLILDDINGLAESADFANWLKSLVDEIATSQKPLPLYILLVGLEGRRQSLVTLQPSLARVFDLVEISAWSKQETKAFYENAFSRAGIQIEEPALEFLVQFTGGLPVLAHEIGDAVFRLDSDGTIDHDEARKAVVEAAEIVGRKHLQPSVFQAIRSTRYRSILRKLARELTNERFQRGEVLERLSGEEKKVFDNFTKRMSQLGVIERNIEAGLGAYKFTNLLHYLYFFIEAER